MQKESLYQVTPVGNKEFTLLGLARYLRLAGIYLMQALPGTDTTKLVTILLLLIGGGLGITLLLLGWVIRRVRRIYLPPDAGLLTTLRATPFTVVILLDLLDLSLDFLSAPIAWVLLGRLGLAPLRGMVILEELVPGTQLIPTMTVAWIIARLIRRKRAT